MRRDCETVGRVIMPTPTPHAPDDVRRVHGMDYRWNCGTLEVFDWRMGWQTSAFGACMRTTKPYLCDVYSSERVDALRERFADTLPPQDA